jgi:hypothetical protein
MHILSGSYLLCLSALKKVRQCIVVAVRAGRERSRQGSDKGRQLVLACAGAAVSLGTARMFYSTLQQMTPITVVMRKQGRGIAAHRAYSCQVLATASNTRHTD